jgi:hypothetical protein
LQEKGIEAINVQRRVIIFPVIIEEQLAVEPAAAILEAGQFRRNIQKIDNDGQEEH